MKKTTKFLYILLCMALFLTNAMFIAGCSHTDTKNPDLSSGTVSDEPPLTENNSKDSETPSPVPSPVSASITCSNSWEENGQSFAQYDITILNSGDSDVTDWILTLSAAEDVEISQSWNCNIEKSKDGNTLTLTPVSYNTSASAGGEITGIGMIVSPSDSLSVKTLDVTTADGESAVINTPQQTSNEETKKPVPPATDAVGALQVSGTQLVDETGNPVQLRGVSTHGLAWFPQYVNYDTFQTLRDDWGTNVIRLAMYTEEYGGYCSGGDRSQLKQLIDDGVQYATQLGMYVIIDWHILNDGNPNTHKSDAIDFFHEMSEKYADYDNVLYEICNEPTNSPWDSVIKPYAEEVISAIRNNDSDAVILVGTNTWSQDVDQVQGNLLSDSNVMYVLHFYAATHGDSLRQKLTTTLNAGIPVFVSECNICDASGNGGIDTTSGDAWLKLLNENNISIIAWNLSNKEESSALLKSSCFKLSGWTEDDLTETGKWFRNAISN